MFGKSVTLFKLFRFQVKIDSSWLIIAVLITWSLARDYFPYKYPYLSQTSYWFMGLLGALGLFASIVLHELGHSLVARNYGIQIKGITLFVFGGVAEMGDEPPTAKSEFRMAIAGPIVSLLVAAGSYLVYFAASHSGGPLLLRGVTFYLAWINALLAVFNLLPAFPLDGGRVLRSYLWKRRGSLRGATRTASRVGSGFGAGLIVLGLVEFVLGNFIGGVWYFLIGLFLRNASKMSYKQLEIRQALEGEPVRRFMKSDLVVVPPSLSIEALVQDYVYRYHFQMFPVMSDSKLLGCISTDQVKDIPRSEWSRHSVSEFLVACSNQNTISPDADAVGALALMNRTGNSRLMVLAKGQLLGVITLKDLLDFLSLKLDLETDKEEKQRIEKP